MPIYEYRCSSCGFQKDHLQKITDPVLTDCPECGKATYRKMLTAAGFQLKGSGWYATDFRNSGAKPAARASGKDGHSDSKSEAKTESKTSDAKPGSAPAASGASAPCAPEV